MIARFIRFLISLFHEPVIYIAPPSRIKEPPGGGKKWWIKLSNGDVRHMRPFGYYKAFFTWRDKT